MHVRASTSALRSSSLREPHCCDAGGGGGEDGAGEEGMGERKDKGSGKRGPVLGGARDWAGQKALSSIWPSGTGRAGQRNYSGAVSGLGWQWDHAEPRGRS